MQQKQNNLGISISRTVQFKTTALCVNYSLCVQNCGKVAMHVCLFLVKEMYCCNINKV